MKATRTRLQGVLGVGRPRIFILLGLLVGGSILSILTSLSTSVPVSALTQAQKDFCISNFGKVDTEVRAPSGNYAAGWTDNECDSVCKTKAGTSFRGLPPRLTSTGCDANASVLDGPAGKTSDAVTLGILQDKYANSAVAGYCGNDSACVGQWQSKIRDRVYKCVESYDYDANKTVFPDIAPGALANCVSTGLNFSSAKEKAIKDQLTADHDAITAEAQSSSNADTQAACEDGGGQWNTETQECSEPAGTDCAVEGIGWLICPAITFMAQLNDKAYAFLASHFLSVDTELVTRSKDAWAKFRDIANVLFVIAFLIVVYSQLTSVGINNYGIKKMLPKIVIAAVLVNMSFIICQLAVDVSNILGYGISTFFNGLTIANVDDGTTAPLLGGTSNLSWVAVFGAVIAGAIGVALGIGLPVIISALFAIGMIVLILIGRQALIVLLVAIAPVAFVAYLLPNTDQWFKKWVKMFSTLLLLFPIIALVFGASHLAAVIVNNAAGKDPLMQVVALGITALPFFVVPGLLKGALNAAGAVGTKLSGIADRQGKNVGARMKDSSRIGTGLADMKKYRDQQRAIKYAKGRSKGVVGAIGRVPGIGGKKYAEKTAIRADSLEHEEYEADVKAAETLLQSRTYGDKQLIAQGKMPATAAERDAAIRFMMSSGNFKERREVLEAAGDMDDHQRRSAVNGARAKGDTGVYGSTTLGKVEEGKIDNDGVAAQLARGATEKVETGEATVETFTRDSHTAGYMAEHAKKASGAKQKEFADNLTAYASTEAGQKMPGAVRAHLDNVVNAAGSGPAGGGPTPPPATPPPSSPPPSPPPGGTGGTP